MSESSKQRYETVQRSKAKKMTLSRDAMLLLTTSIENVWKVIGKESPHSKNTSRIESCLDQNRLLHHGGYDGRRADALLSDLCAKHGWTNVINLLSSNLELQEPPNDEHLRP
jgi:hypothetical protein